MDPLSSPWAGVKIDLFFFALRAAVYELRAHFKNLAYLRMKRGI